MKLITTFLILFGATALCSAQDDLQGSMFFDLLKKSTITGQPILIRPDKQVCNPESKSIVDISSNLLRQSKAGDKQALTEVAFLYLGSNHCSDLREGAVWLQKAAEAGSVDAAGELGYAYLYGEYSLEQNLEESEKWLQVAVAAKDGIATYNMAQLHRIKPAATPDDRSISSWFKRAADLGMDAAVFEYAFRCAEGIGIESVDDTGCSAYIKKARLSDYRVGYSVNQTLRTYYGELATVKWQIDEDSFSSESGDISYVANAIYRMAFNLGDLSNKILEGELKNKTDAYRVVMDPQVGFNYSIHLYHAAAQLGHPEAQFMMKHIYQNEKWENSSKVMANYWSQRLLSNLNSKK